MISTVWHALIFDPLYNALVLLIDFVPGGEVGIAIILLTIAVKILLLPLALKAARTQLVIRRIEPELKEIQEKYQNDAQQRAVKVMEIYRRERINPFSIILLLLIQIPVILALYLVFFGGATPELKLPNINLDLVYSFVPVPEHVDMSFFGIDVAGKSLVLALLAGIAQFFQSRLAAPPVSKPKEGEKPSFKDDFTRSMNLNIRYGLPIIIFIFAYVISAAVALYFLVGNLFGIFQELYVKRRLAEEHPEATR